MPDPLCCPSCGEILPVLGELTEKVELKDDTIRDQQRKIRQQRVRIGQLQRDRDSKNEMDPSYDDAVRVFDYWREKLVPKAREFTGERFEKVVARLHAGATPRELKRAIDGAVLRPFVGDKGRMATGRADQRRVDLALICRSEEHVQRFISYADAEGEGTAGASQGPVGPMPPSILSTHTLEAMQEALTPQVAGRLYDLRGWGPGAIEELELGIDGDRVVFPLRDAAGNLTGVARFQPNREKRGDSPKLIAQGARELFPAPESVQSSSCWLVEGEPDAVALRSVHLPVVAVPGVNTWKADWAQRFSKFERVYIAMDCDERGRACANARSKQLSEVTTVSIVDLAPERDDGYDVGDFVLRHGDSTAAQLGALHRSEVAPFQPRLPDKDTEPPFARLVRHLESADCKVQQRTPGHATAQCPAHDDRQPSLSLSEGDDGRVLMNCHTGCTPDEICSALGLELRDLFARAS